VKSLIKLEEAALFLLSVYLFSLLPYKWWLFPALLLVPDVGMIGYLFNPGIGAFTYNLFHHRGIAIVIYLAGIYLANPVLQLAGIILFGHASMDRVFGYGLKYNDDFKNTHLGRIGKVK
jgi:hypothetical protein